MKLFFYINKEKIYLDFDHATMSYNEIIEICENFEKFLQIEYGFADKLTYRIHASLKCSFQC